MEDLDSETDFDEMSARDITQTILEDDVKIYKKFLPEIKKLDSKSFKNMFYGNKNYCYNIRNRMQFNLLLDKFDNFKILLDEWYEDPDTYHYIKELWVNYIGLESLKDKNESEIQNFLLSKNIDYKSWPERIKNRFKLICNNTTNTIINKFRKVYQKLPEIVKKILGMIYSASEYCLQKGEKILSNYMVQYLLSIFGGFINIGLNNISLIKGICCDLSSKFKISDFTFQKCIEFLKKNAKNYKELAKTGFESKFALISYGIASVYKLYSSINSYNEIKNTMKKIEGFEKALDELEKNFQNHKNLIDSRLESTESRDIKSLNDTIESCIILVNADKSLVTKLIREINSCLEESRKAKKKEIVNLIGSIIQTGVGIAGAVLTGGFTCVLYIGGFLLNGASVVLNGINIDNLGTNIKDLEGILQRAQNLDKEVDEELEKIRVILSENKDAAPTYF